MVKDSFVMADAIAQQDNLLTRLDPRWKVVLSALGLALVLGVPGLRVSIGVFLLVLAALLTIRIPIRVMLGRLTPPLALGGIVFILLLLLYPGQHPVYLFKAAGLRLPIYQENIQAGLSILTRIMGSVSVAMFLSVTTPIYEIGYALLWFRVPKALVEILLLTYRYIFVLGEEAQRIKEAQTLRLGYPSWRKVSGWKRALQSTVTLMGMVFIRSVDRAEGTFAAMQVRAYNGSFPAPRTRGWRKGH